MLETKTKGNIIVISGPSGVGKDTIVKNLLKEMDNIILSVSYTTREKREKEEDGKDYFFITKEEFEEKIKNNEFLEYATYINNYYGTSKRQVKKLLNEGIDVILVIEVKGTKIIKELIPDAILIFIMPPSLEELKNRLKKRTGDSKEQISDRLETAYQEIKQYKKYNYVVTNDDINNAVEKVKSIIIAEKCRIDRIISIDLGID